MRANKIKALVGAAVVTLMTWGAGDARADSAAELAAIHAANEAFVKAFNSGDVDAVVNLYDEHAVLFPAGARSQRGRAAIRAYFVPDNAAFLKNGLSFELGASPAGGVSGNLGWSAGSYNVKDKSGRVVDTGWYFSVSRKTSGKWLYVRDAYNSEGPPAAAQPAAPAKQ